MVAARLPIVRLVLVAALCAAIGIGARACATGREPVAAAAVPPAPREVPAEIVHVARPIDHLRSARDRDVARIALDARAQFPLDEGQRWTEIHHRVERVIHLDDADDIAVVSSFGPGELCRASRVTAVVVRGRRVRSMVLLGTGCLDAGGGVDVITVRRRHLMIFRYSEGGSGTWREYQRYFWEAMSGPVRGTRTPTGTFESAGCLQTRYDNTDAGWSGPGDEYVWHGAPRFSGTGDLTVRYKIDLAGPRASRRKLPRVETFRFDGVHGWQHLTANAGLGTCHAWDDR